jgi:CHAD domain-containing protein
MVVTKVLKCEGFHGSAVFARRAKSRDCNFALRPVVFESPADYFTMPVAQERVALVFEKIERALSQLSSKQTPVSVHNFRTAARRMQTLFEELLAERDRNQKKLLKLLSRMRKRAGKIRDLDAELAALRSLKVSQEPRRKTQLVQEMIELRASHEKKLRKALTKQLVREIRKRLRRARKDLRLEEFRDPRRIAQKMLSQAAVPNGPLTEEMLHRQRILTKRARYVAEFASKSPETDLLIEQLKHAQDALGDWHDWFMLTETSLQSLGDVHQSSLVAVLHNVTGAKFRKAVSALTSDRAPAALEKTAATRKTKMGTNHIGSDSSSVAVTPAA